MAKDITVVIGARKVGKTTAVNILNSFYVDAVRMNPLVDILSDFLFLHEMTAESFTFDRETNYKLLFLFKELQEQKHPRYYLHKFLADIEKANTIIIDDVYSYIELDALIKLKAKIILIEATDLKRTEYGYTKGMDKVFYAQEVSNINRNIIKHWKNTLVIDNNKSISDLRLTLRNHT